MIHLIVSHFLYLTFVVIRVETLQIKLKSVHGIKTSLSLENTSFALKNFFDHLNNNYFFFLNLAKT